MGTGTGLDAQLAVAEQNNYATAATTLTRRLEMVSENITPSIQKIYSQSTLNSRFQRASRVRTYLQGATGDVTMEVATTGFGLLFKHALGDVDTRREGESNEYIHTFTPDPDGLRGLALTMQVGRPMTDGTVVPYTYYGGKVASWSLSAAVEQALTLTLSMDFAGQTLDTALSNASYPAGGDILTFIDGSVVFEDVEIKVGSLELEVNNALKLDRFSLGNVKREPLANAAFEVTGTLEMDFEDDALVERMFTGEVGELVLSFALLGSEIDEGLGNPYQLQVTIPAVEFTGEPPTVSGPDIVAAPLAFKALANGEDPIISIAYHTTDSTP